MAKRSDELILPPAAAQARAEEQQQEQPVPMCAGCHETLEIGDPVVSIVMDAGPGTLQLAPAHLRCVLQIGRDEDEETPDGG